MNSKLIIGLSILAVIIIILIFGRPITGFSILSFAGLDSQNTPDEYTTNKALLEQVLKENPDRAARLDDYGRNELERAISQDKDITKEKLEGLLQSVTQTSEEIAEIEKLAKESKHMTPAETGGYEENFVIGGKTYSEEELQQMSKEQIEELIRQKQNEEASR